MLPVVSRQKTTSTFGLAFLSAFFSVFVSAAPAVRVAAAARAASVRANRLQRNITRLLQGRKLGLANQSKRVDVASGPEVYSPPCSRVATGKRIHGEEG